MQTVWKFTLSLADGIQQVSMPAEAVVVKFEFQDETPCVWAIVNPEEEKKTRFFCIYGTGHPIPENMAYVGTCQQGRFVWHLFEPL